MTLDKLIERLSAARAKLGGDCEVKVMQDDDEMKFEIYGTVGFEDKKDDIQVTLVIEVE